MPRLLALLALVLLLSSCAAPPPVASVEAAALPRVQPTLQPSVTPRPPATAAPTAVPTGAPIVIPTAVATATLPPPPPEPRYDLVLLGGSLIDATGAPALDDAAVAIADGRIAAVGPAATLAFSPDTPVRDVRGATILPGFINAHVHIAGLSDDQLRGWTRAGVTTIRDLAGDLDAQLARRNSLDARDDPGLPRLLVAGPIVTAPGGYPFAVADPALRVAGWGVRGPNEAQAAAAALADAGVDLVKLAVSGRTDVSWPELADAEIAAIAETARARGLRVSAHIDRASALRRAVLNGVNDAAHSPRDHLPDAVIALLVERGVTLTPTIAVYEALAFHRGKGAEWRRLTQPVMYDNVRRFVAAGGTLALGDDYGGVPGMPVGMPMAELRHWQALGLTAEQIIVAATRGSAIACGIATEVGTVEPGKVADLLVVQGDPREDLGALARPLLVLRGGHPVE
ncbi:MAG TPA: amidohydrolase family protein [Chloroflexaceae bacterium]|nr:amidohydrolase family protein [Chloroflexaceae bacterium]